MNLSDAMKRAALQGAFEFLERDPDTNLPKLVDWLKKADRYGAVSRYLPTLEAYAHNPDSNWYRLIRSLWDDVDGGVRKTLFTNIVVNSGLQAMPRLEENRKKYRCRIPWAIHLTPGPPENGLSFDELDGILEQGKALGTFFYMYSGIELPGRQEELLALANKHSDCQFVPFIHGDQVDGLLAEELLRVRNLLPALILDQEDLHAASPFRVSGEAMSLLQKEKLAFGAACPCREESLSFLKSEPFFDNLIARGAKFSVFFTQLPLYPGDAPASTACRAELHRALDRFRESKALLTVDLCGDADQAGGCMACGRGLCWIGPDASVRPCALAGDCGVSIRDTPLVQAYQSPLFLRFPDGMPAACLLLDEEQKAKKDKIEEKREKRSEEP